MKKILFMLVALVPLVTNAQKIRVWQSGAKMMLIDTLLAQQPAASPGDYKITADTRNHMVRVDFTTGGQPRYYMPANFLRRNYQPYHPTDELQAVMNWASETTVFTGGSALPGKATRVDTARLLYDSGVSIQRAGNDLRVVQGGTQTMRFFTNGSAVLGSGTTSGTSGNLAATSFTGNGSALTALNAGNISTGVLAEERLSGNIVRLNSSPAFTGSVTATGFIGNGAQLTALNAGNISSGTLADARLSANIVRLGSSPVFTGSVTATEFIGAGSQVTGLVAENIASGTLADARLSANVARLNTANAFTGAITAPSFAGSGTLLTGLSADNVTSGTLAEARLPSTVAYLNRNNVFTGTMQAVSFTGSGAGLTALSAGAISTGTLADGRLSANVAFRNAANTFSGANTFTGVTIVPTPTADTQAANKAYVDAALSTRPTLTNSPDQTYANGSGPILYSPDGTKWRITVNNSGQLGTVAVP